ncbi:MAG: class I SAM-dependent methyltransferase [Alphaproteobacteria bacterium]
MAKRQSPRLRPDQIATVLGQAEAARRAGDTNTALTVLLKAARSSPETGALYPALAPLLASMVFDEASPAVAEVVEQALRSPWVDPQPLAAAAISLLKATHALTDNPNPLLGAKLAQDPLLLTLLERTLLPDPVLEGMLVASRRYLLDAAGSNQAPTQAAARFGTAMAKQALLNGWMWRESAEEIALLDDLAKTLATADRFDYGHVAYGFYRPLIDLPKIEDLAARTKAPWREAATALVAEPMEERRLANGVPRLGLIPNAATEAVKSQYEAFPYPRWIANPRRKARPIQDIAATLFPNANLPAWPKGRLNVLIAGCGTGKHVADVASRFQGAKVTGIDLSRTALGYAARKLKGVRDITFAEADIMALSGKGARVDHIESVGVLHHLADPLGGWRILTDLLKPGGTMRVGFYSARGRSRIQAARSALAEAGFHGQDDTDLRAARAHALAAEKDSPAWLATQELDFYAASGSRDFLFHAQEAEYRPSELADMVDALGLEVIGLELTDPDAAQHYREKFPDDATFADLRRWDEVEAEAPDIFRHMCQFWVKRPIS